MDSRGQGRNTEHFVWGLMCLLKPMDMAENDTGKGGWRQTKEGPACHASFAMVPMLW